MRVVTSLSLLQAAEWPFWNGATVFCTFTASTLQGIESTPRIPLAANRSTAIAVPLPVPAGNPPPPGQENQAPKAGQAPRRARVSRPIVFDPMTDTLEIVYNFTLENTGTTHFRVAAVNALLGLPLRPLKACYPGESPTPDGKCPDREHEQGWWEPRHTLHSGIMWELKAKVNKEVVGEYESKLVLGVG
ncbi:hypothetical protein C8R44DRAFT_871751 [Mycena epipterygia]|nr:hypothetical protein C8R44DRAFT_871751 [Mycena epipterygia]